MSRFVKSHDFVIRVDGQPYKLTSDVKFSRSMLTLGGSIEVVVFDQDNSIIKSFRPGKTLTVEIDNQLVFKSQIQTLNPSDSNGHFFTYIGRDATGDLVDCSASFSDGSFSKKNMKLDEALNDILKPFNMRVKTNEIDIGEPLSEINISPGETVAEVMARLCKYRRIKPFTDGIDSVLLSKIGAERSLGSIILGENVMTRSGQISHAGRYSKVTVKGGNNGSSGDAGFGNASAEDLAELEGVAYDPDIKRHRPLIIVSEADATKEELQARAEWEVRHRRFNGTDLTYTVPGWEASEGQFWKINSLVRVEDPELNINRDMLIKAVDLNRDSDGTTSSIMVAPAESYDLPPAREPKTDDELWGGGA
ncbi:MAG: hypothetical protein CBB87_08010 [Micavibrio sp. TMED27]|nr:hypothetical protein [Micavibrio sp.]OUT90615.1 MAG: hypothetical protein CBB87_08010 [Micavibrio sp. TMED27]|tara:strand:+ start:943 stop:2034 length:1092 start_codon:yes stop_codon:yes gene_type:complete